MEECEGENCYELKAKETTAKKSYKKVELKVTVDEATDTFHYLTVKVEETAPKLTIKQSGKVNLFYNEEEGAAVLNVTGDKNISKVELTECDYTVDETEEGYLINRYAVFQEVQSDAEY